MILPASNSSTNTWKSIFLTFEPGANVSIEVVAGSILLQYTIDLEFPDTSIESVTVGNQYFGLIQDFQIYTPSLEVVGGRTEVPPEADFLPQCLCPSGSEISSNQDECIAEGGGQMNRWVCYWLYIPYSQKFSRTIIFAVFANQLPTAKILPSNFSILVCRESSKGRSLKIKITKSLLNAHLRIFYASKISSCWY